MHRIMHASCDHAWRYHGLRGDERFAPALRGQVTVGLLFHYNSCIIPPEIVPISVLDSLNNSVPETAVKCMHKNFDPDLPHPQTGL